VLDLCVTFAATTIACWLVKQQEHQQESSSGRAVFQVLSSKAQPASGKQLQQR
jgi:hypothetical protein